MASISVRRHIAAPVDEVFARASDFARAPDVIEGIAKVEMLTGGPVGQGTRFRETRIMFGREAIEEMEVTAFDPPRRYALGCENHGCRYHSELRFTPSGSGTDVEMSFDATPLTTIAKIMSLVMRPMMRSLAKTCLKDLDDLKSALESSA
ncbi:MAG: SRPBCC family protein [Acidobacteriota bacterium]|nr:SRPBCC family protein [Acidobacteriota bacterium]